MFENHEAQHLNSHFVLANPVGVDRVQSSTPRQVLSSVSLRRANGVFERPMTLQRRPDYGRDLFL